MIETAMVGRDGVRQRRVGARRQGRRCNKAIVQMTGTRSVISADALSQIADEHRALRALLIRHEQVLFAQSQQSGACNASHLVEAAAVPMAAAHARPRRVRRS